MSVRDDLKSAGLCVLGTVEAQSGDEWATGAQQLILIGPDEPAFWLIFRAAPEYSDGQTDPVNRWSTRVITQIANQHDAVALFPFGGPPWPPFISWALRAATIFSSPVSLLVHSERGLFVSFRAALALKHKLPPMIGTSPCTTCSAPCLTVCPVNALTADGYDVAACTAHIATVQGRECMQGCLVRRSCPVGGHLRLEEQSAFHMDAFLRSNI